jgi:uncharacterized protein (UPF0261 family)
MRAVVVAGTYDTKSEPLAALEARLASLGAPVTTLDVSVFPSAAIATHDAHAVAASAGCTHEEIGRLDRAEAVAMMAEGGARLISGMCEAGRVGALVMMGGSNAAATFSRLAAAVPYGVPKIFMGTFVSGDTKRLVSARDAVLLYPVVDVDGANSILDTMIDRLARTAVALAAVPELPTSAATSERRVAVSMYGVTTPCVQALRRKLESDGDEVLVFHANGTGGRTIEGFARERMVDAVADVTLAELVNEVLGGGFPAGPDRMTGAAEAGVPQVVVPGAADMIAFGPPESVPERFRDRQQHRHNEFVTLVRISREDSYVIGRALAGRMGRPRAPTTVCIPMGGFSMLDCAGGVFRDSNAAAAFAEGFRSAANPAIRIVTTDENINDPAFADLLFLELAAVRAGGRQQEREKG